MLHPNNLFLSTRLIFALFPALHPYLSKALEHRPRVPRARDGARRVLLAQRKFVRRRAEETPVHLRPRWRGAALLAAGNIFGVVLVHRLTFVQSSLRFSCCVFSRYAYLCIFT